MASTRDLPQPFKADNCHGDIWVTRHGGYSMVAYTLLRCGKYGTYQ